MEDVPLGILSDSLRDGWRKTSATPTNDTVSACLCENKEENQTLLPVPQLIDSRQIDDVNMFLRSEYYQKKFASASKGKFKVRTPEDLEELTQKLLSKPFIIDFKWEKVEVCFPARVYTAEGDALLYVNSQHPSVRRELKLGLEEAKKLMRENKKFYLEFDFRASISAYLRSKIQIQEEDDRLEDCRCGLGKISISNCRKYSTIFKFKDQTCPLWVICSPLCLFSFPCYMIYRKLSCRDVSYSVKLNTGLISGEIEAGMLKNHIEEELATEDNDSTISSSVLGNRDSKMATVRQRVKRWTHSVSGKNSELSVHQKDKIMRIL
ncbi:uncharacterized protein [Ptychodera flava]|uniref:uncharacterized protein n=1 Tax=Ptychodera flava TaxID=63121 RepID=UPI00396A892A